MRCFHEVVGIEQNGGDHQTWFRWDALAAAEKHGKGDNDAVETRCGIHVEGSQGGAGKACYLIGHYFECYRANRMAAWAGAPLGIVEASNNEALVPVEIGFHQVNYAQLVEKHVASAFWNLPCYGAFPAFPVVAVGHGDVQVGHDDGFFREVLGHWV